MEVTTEITAADYKSFLIDYYYSKNKLQTLFAFVCVAVLSAMWFHDYRASSGNLGFAFLAFEIFMSLYLVFICVPYGIQAAQLNNTFKKSLFLNTKITVNAYASGISIENEAINDFFAWDIIKQTINTTNYVAVYLIDKRLLLIPKTDFANAETAKLFYYKINNGWLNTKGGIKQFQNPRSPSYLWGLIGIFPIIGAINGVIMILMGVIQYKDYKYCLIGLLGILFSVGFFKYMKYTTTQSPQMSVVYSSMAQTELNDLTKDIEFYKFQNKQYPDSLQQLTTERTLVIINDPILTYRHMSDEMNMLFNYKRIGNKYTLFSSGLDEEPHTADDIYPIISISDTSKSGFMKE